jgi:hypothetical protein
MVLDGLKACGYGEKDFQELVVDVKDLGVLEFLSPGGPGWDGIAAYASPAGGSTLR